MNNQYFKGYSTKYDIRGLFKGNDLSLVIEARDSTTGTAAPFDFTYYDATFKVYQKGNNRLILDLTPTLTTGTDIDTDPSTITVTDAALTDGCRGIPICFKPNKCIFSGANVALR
jgi:hypothetical protein